MRKILTRQVATLMIMLTAGLGVPYAQPAASTLTINANGAPAAGVAVVLLLVNRGKVQAGTTDGAGQVALDLANMPKVRVEVSVETCNQEMHVLITQPGAQQDNQCNRRIIGFWIWGNGSPVVDTGAGTLTVVGGQSTLFTRRNIAIAGGGLLGLVLLVALAGGGDSSSGASADSGGGTGSSGPPTFAFTDVNGTHTLTATRNSDPCSFFSSSFSGSTIVQVNSSGTGTVTIGDPGLTRLYNVTGLTSGANRTLICSSTPFTISGRAFTAILSIVFSSPTSYSGSETFNGVNPACGPTIFSLTGR